MEYLFGVLTLKGKLKGYDFILLLTPVLLASFGVVMVYSSSMVSATMDGLGSTFYLKRQLMWFVLSLIVFGLTALFPYQKYRRYLKIILFLSFISLVMVLLVGKNVNNAIRSISILGFNIQPSEIVKISIIMYTAYIYSKKQDVIRSFRAGVVKPVVFVAIIIGLIVMQPDLGTSLVIASVMLIMMISAGVRFKHFITLSFIGGVLLTPFVYFTDFVTSTRRERFSAVISPFSDADESGFQLIQSYLAIGGGDPMGEGLGQSIQKLGYLWGAHTDFIMAIIAEELGVIGVVVVILAYIIMMWKGLDVAKKCRDGFGSLLAIGLTSMISVQAIINLGAISGMLPITGITLPFISYGGSSLLACMMAMGILNNIAQSTNNDLEEASTN